MLYTQVSATGQHFIFAQEALRQAVKRLQAVHSETASLDARLLLQYVLSITHEEWVANPERMLDPKQAVQYHELVEKRVESVPLAHLTESREFWGLNFKVTSATLDPRADSETVVEAVLQRIENHEAPLKIFDLGTGTGCLVLSLLSELPNAHGVAIDKCAEALKVATENAARLGLENRVQFLHASWEEKMEGAYDIIVSNPPYIPSLGIDSLMPEVSRYEPRLALDGGPDGLDCYRAIFSRLAGWLKPGGMAAFEMGYGQLPSLISLATHHGFRMEAMRKDMQGTPRCIIVKPNC